MQPKNTVTYQAQRDSRSKFKLVIILGICLILGIMAAGALFDWASNNADVNNKFLKSIAKGDSKAAYALIEKPTQSEEQFKKNFVEPIRGQYDMTQCKTSSPKDKPNITVAACPSTTNRDRLVLQIELNNNGKISRYAIK